MTSGFLLLDTGPLRELITYQAVRVLGFQKLRGNLSFFLDPGAFDRFGKYIAPFPRRVTSTSVLVELHRWIRDKTDANGHSKIWSLVYDELRGMGLEEQNVNLLDMRREVVARHGPADCSMLHLAERNLEFGPVVVTVDDRLQPNV